MSWDIVAFKSPEGFDPSETAQLVIAALGGTDASWLPGIDREAMSHLLRLRLPKLVKRTVGPAPLAYDQASPEEEAAPLERIDLWWEAGEVSLHVMITDFAVCASLPFGRDDADDATVSALARLVRVLARDAGMMCYDPQSERVVEVPTDENLIH